MIVFQLQNVSFQVIENMKNLYHKANLIHADLSEYNILWYNNTCYFIDVSQAVEPCNENAFIFLMRDCDNVINVSVKLSNFYYFFFLIKLLLVFQSKRCTRDHDSR